MIVAVPAVAEKPPLAVRLMFVPFRIASKRLAPRVSATLFERVWRIVDHEGPPPRAEDEQRSVVRLAAALALEGACTAIVTGLIDHAARREFARITGRWPSRPRKS